MKPLNIATKHSSSCRAIIVKINRDICTMIIINPETNNEKAMRKHIKKIAFLSISSFSLRHFIRELHIASLFLMSANNPPSALCTASCVLVYWLDSSTSSGLLTSSGVGTRSNARSITEVEWSRDVNKSAAKPRLW